MLRLFISIILSISCLTSVSGIEVTNNELHMLHDKWVIALAKQIFQLRKTIDLPDSFFLIEEMTFEGLIETNQLMKRCLPPGKNGIGKSFTLDGFNFASKFSNNEINELQITIFSEHPDFKNSTYIIELNKRLKRTNLSLNDMKALSILKS